MENEFDKQIRKEEFIFNLVSRSFIAFLILLIFMMITSCSQSISPAKRYAKEHSDKNFQSVMKNNTAFTLSSAKQNLQEVKKRSKQERKKDKKQDKINSVLAKIEKLKSN